MSPSVINILIYFLYNTHTHTNTTKFSVKT